MIDYVTRGLAMLADEAEPAPIDSHDVIARARARTRTRRAVTAAAFATVVVVSTLVMTVGDPGAPDKPATTTTVKTPESLPDQLDRLLTDALPDVIPSRWEQVPGSSPQDLPLTFLCVGDGCFANVTYDDGVGKIDILFRIDDAKRDWDALCDPEHCTELRAPVRQDLSDGTRTQVFTYADKSTSRDVQELLAARPDGTQVTVSAIWPQGQRAEPPLTTDEILKFATVFTYDAARDVGLTPPASTTPAAGDPNRAKRLNQKLTDVLADVVPADWSQANKGAKAPFEFDCTFVSKGPIQPDVREQPTSEGCRASGDYRDDAGKISLMVFISHVPAAGGENCQAPECVDRTLPDGTMARVWIPTKPDGGGTYFHTLAATRPDGTRVFVRMLWTDRRSGTPITTKELLKFATAFRF